MWTMYVGARHEGLVTALEGVTGAEPRVMHFGCVAGRRTAAACRVPPKEYGSSGDNQTPE